MPLVAVIPGRVSRDESTKSMNRNAVMTDRAVDFRKALRSAGRRGFGMCNPLEKRQPIPRPRTPTSSASDMARMTLVDDSDGSRADAICPTSRSVDDAAELPDKTSLPTCGGSSDSFSMPSGMAAK